MQIARIWSLLPALALLLGGCTVPGSDEGPQNIAVDAEDNRFVPNNLQLHQNDAITVTNTGALMHSVTIHKGGDAVTTLKKDTDIAPGTSTTYTFEELGTYHVYCKYHSGGTTGSFGQGMVLTVVVEAEE